MVRADTKGSVKQFILVSKEEFYKSGKIESKEQGQLPEIGHLAKEPALDVIKTNEPEQISSSPTELDKTVIREKILTVLNSTRPLLLRDRRKQIKSILDILLDSKSVDVEFSSLIVAVDGQPIPTISAPKFIADLIQYNTRLDAAYIPVLARLREQFSNSNAVKNREAKVILKRSTTGVNIQTGDGYFKQNGSKRKSNARIAQENKRTSKKKRAKTSSTWISL